MAEFQHNLGELIEEYDNGKLNDGQDLISLALLQFILDVQLIGALFVIQQIRIELVN